MARGFPIRLKLETDEQRLLSGEPVGFVAPRAGSADLVIKMTLRHQHHPSLRLALTDTSLIVLGGAGEPLPWVENARHYLVRREAVFMPAGMALDAPARWGGPLIDRVVREQKLDYPVLLLPKGDSIELTSLSGARLLATLDPVGVAAMCQA